MCGLGTQPAIADDGERRLLYVAAPGIRNYLEYGGHGLLVFDIDDGHTFVKRIPTAGLDATASPRTSRGSAPAPRQSGIYISTIRHADLP